MKWFYLDSAHFWVQRSGARQLTRAKVPDPKMGCSRIQPEAFNGFYDSWMSCLNQEP